MANQYFSVKEQVFEISFTNRGKVHELQDRISKITNDRLIDAMDDCFEKLVPADTLIKLDSVLLDIGEISIDSLENELETKLIDALEQQLSKLFTSLRLNGSLPGEENAVVTPISNNEDILSHFLYNGILPWWVQKDIGFRLDNVVSELFQQEPEVLRALLLRAGRNEHVRRRLVQQFKEESIRQVITVLEPSESAYILGYHSEVVTIQRKEQVIQAETSAFEKAVWLFILNYLLNERGGDFNRKAFVKSNLVQMAAYFNIDYLELLTIFYRAVSVKDVTLSPASSLEAFIKELTIEEEIANAEQFTVTLHPANAFDEKDPESLAAKADLLVYYFRFGSLPDGNNGYSISALGDIFSELVRDIPGSLKNILYSLKEGVRFADNFYALLGVERSRELLNVLYPGTARLLATFTSLIDWIQINKPFIGADADEVKKKLSSLAVPHILFADHHNSDQLLLLRSFIADIASAYGMSSKAITVAAHESLQQAFRQGIMNSNLPELIAKLAADSEAPGDTRIISVKDFTGAAGSEANERIAKQGLLDTLIHLVQYGTVPWWGKQFFETGTADEKFRSLLLDAPADMNAIIRMAGSEPRWQERLIAMVSPGTMYDILQTLPGGAEGVSAIQRVLGWFERSAVKDKLSAGMPERILMQSLWDDIANHAYRSFSITGFYSVSVVRLAAYLGIQPVEVAVMLEKAAAKKGPAAVLERNILSDLADILSTNMGQGIFARDREAYKGRSAAISPEIQKDQELEVMLLLSASLPQEGLVTPGKLNSEALRLVEYFFTWNRLPGEWDETAYLPIPIMLKQMLLLTYKESRTALESLLKSVTHIPAARIFFHELVSEARGGIEKEVALFLKPYKESYHQLFLETEQAKAVQQAEQLGVSASAEIIPVAGVAEWEQWIEMFLRTGNFPEQAGNENRFRSIVIQLYLADKSRFKKILDNKPYHFPLARVRLHDMFAGQAGYLERGVAYLLDPYREEDIVVLLRSRSLGTDQADTEKILLRLLTPGKKLRDLADLRQLAVTSPVLIQYLTSNMSQAGISLFIEKTGTGWGQETAILMQQLARLLEEAAPGNLERDKLLSSLLQFNLLFLSGRLYIKSGKAYLQAFFAYLQQAVSYALPVKTWKAVLGYTEEPVPPVTTMATTYISTIQKEIQSIITRSEILKPILVTEDESRADAELQKQKQQQLEEIRAELERERLREEERREKEFRKLQEDKNNKIYIRNAGLVLLHPFLGTYFTRLGLLDKGKFIDELSQYRAVLLLQYLVNGRNESEEYELALNKILCGLPIEEPIPLIIDLTEEEIAVSEEIFQVIFQRWEKMKNTSVQGFRASFIQREGALSRMEEDWELRVEQRAYDMLLDTLPWAFGMIKNAWMTKILTVEWN